ncbi:MAG: Fic family protein [Alkalispirochaeta sp.]
MELGEYIWQRDEWPRFRWNSAALLKPLGVARSTHGELVAQGDKLSLTDQLDLYVDEAIATSEIEGEVLDRNRLRSSVAEQLGLPTAGLPRPDTKSDALATVLLEATRNHDRPLTAGQIQGWQAALFPTGYSGPFRIAVGRWRQSETPMHVVSGAMGRERIHFTAPPPERLHAEMDRFSTWWNGESDDVDGVIRAGLAHLYFVTIHPFPDGNGRIARVLTDMALAQDEGSSRRMYSLSQNIRTVRNEYYAVLEETQRGDLDVTHWLLWFIDIYRRSITDALNRIDRSCVIAQYYRRLADLSLNERQIKVIHKMIDAYPEGFSGGMTNKKYVAITGTSSETAKRDLRDLLSKGLLQKGDAAGRSTYYVLGDIEAG